LAFKSAHEPTEKEVSEFVRIHGDAVQDVAITVDDCRRVYEKALANGAVSLMPPTESRDESGFVLTARLQAFGDLVHTLVERKNYKGVFLPGFIKHPKKEVFNEKYSLPEIKNIDHVGYPQFDDDMKRVVEQYFRMFDFHQFWSVDENVVHSDYSSLRTTVISDYDSKVKMPIFEPVQGLRAKSQIKEFTEYNGGPGIQHIACITTDIIKTVKALRERGVDFLDHTNRTYYEDIKKGLEERNLKIKEDLETLEKLHIMIDYDENGYLLQIFTKPLEDRPTLFFEFIQRNNHEGFGVNNFKSLFMALEKEQKKRGNL
jgi:4-hydroxyphenylpyruvate dioxygenase